MTPTKFPCLPATSAEVSPKRLKRSKERPHDPAHYKHLGGTCRDQFDANAAATMITPGVERFETEQEAAREDRLRARQARRVLNQPGLTNWINWNDRQWLSRQCPRHLKRPLLDHEALGSLAERLEAGNTSGFSPTTLASSMRMRLIRQDLSRALLDGFEGYADDELRTVTVIYSGWAYTPDTLDAVTAEQIKGQFRQHLNRAGVTRVPGPLFAVLHGEFEPTSGVYQLHYHVVTTAAKAAALMKLLATIAGYKATATGAAPVRRSRVGDRLRQFTYLAKGYWPGKPVVEIDGKPKRVRKHGRIPEPFGAQVLLWLDRQSFADLVVMTDCWSPRNGGIEAMRALYLFVQGRGKRNGSAGPSGAAGGRLGGADG
ncbi:hypothetical protein MPEAHAMD_6960 [Methylobacterium frigidaeris]|uniref:Uncharacterized protein n=2 Tax=Methylobacterium frigidaeris TaxID=2038277 RepID=A0AA37HII4_9HYPH|nr:hypothetical protein MPEAHAMD_6960 [Methylobacterium frigidaeris]